MRALAIRSFLLICLTAAALLPAAAKAQQGQLQALEEPDQPGTTPGTVRAGRDSATETRLPGGRVTGIEVRRGTSTYYLQPQTAAGGARESGRTAQWNVLNFDLPQGRAAQSAPQPALVPPPPRSN
jgi:hypothetical protein